MGIFRMVTLFITSYFLDFPCIHLSIFISVVFNVELCRKRCLNTSVHRGGGGASVHRAGGGGGHQFIVGGASVHRAGGGASVHRAGGGGASVHCAGGGGASVQSRELKIRVSKCIDIFSKRFINHSTVYNN